MAKSMKLGMGGRFSKLKGKVEKEGYSPKVAGAIAAKAGRKAHGSAAMAGWSAKGRKRSLA